MNDYPKNIGPNNPEYVPKHIEFTLGVPSHPAILTVLVDCLEKIKDATVALAMRDCEIEEDQSASELLVKAAENHKGAFMNAEAWARSIQEIGTLLNKIDRTAASEWVEFFGDDHPLARLTKMTYDSKKEPTSHEDFFAEMKNVAIGINSDCYDDDAVIEANIKSAQSPEELLMVLRSAATP